MAQFGRFAKFFTSLTTLSEQQQVKQVNDTLAASQLHADLRLAWKLLEDAGHDAAAERLFRFLTKSAAATIENRCAYDMAAIGASGERLYVLTPEECFEVKQAVTDSMKRTEAAVANLQENPSMAGPGGVVERAKYSNRILAGVLRKFT